MTRVLITGGRGYVAGRLAQGLPASGWTPRLGSRHPDAIVRATDHRTEYVRTDYDTPESLRAACRDCAAVVHLAAPDEVESAADPEAAFIASAIGTRRLVEAAAGAGVRRFIRLSTAHVYGPLQGTIDERSCPRPTHPYGIAHRAAEDWVLAADPAPPMSRVVVRLSNGFGAPVQPATSRWKLLVNDLCRQAVETGTLTLRSDGGAWRNFLPLGDVERLAVHLLDVDDAALEPGVFNAGSAQSMRVMDMVERVAGRCELLLHRRPPIVAPPPAGHEYPHLHYGIDRLLGTGFMPLGDVDGEIDRLLRVCLEWFGAREERVP